MLAYYFYNYDDFREYNRPTFLYPAPPQILPSSFYFFKYVPFCNVFLFTYNTLLDIFYFGKPNKKVSSEGSSPSVVSKEKSTMVEVQPPGDGGPGDSGPGPFTCPLEPQFLELPEFFAIGSLLVITAIVIGYFLCKKIKKN